MSDGPLLLIIVIVGALLLLLGPLIYSALNEAGGHGQRHSSTTRHTATRNKPRSHKSQPQFFFSEDDEDEDEGDKLEALFSELIQPTHHQKRRK